MAFGKFGEQICKSLCKYSQNPSLRKSLKSDAIFEGMSSTNVNLRKITKTSEAIVAPEDYYFS